MASYTGVDPGFKVRGAHLKKMRRAEGGTKFFWVFRVKNHDFTPKNHIFSNAIHFILQTKNGYSDGSKG